MKPSSSSIMRQRNTGNAMNYPQLASRQRRAACYSGALVFAGFGLAIAGIYVYADIALVALAFALIANGIYGIGVHYRLACYFDDRAAQCSQEEKLPTNKNKS